jgi:opacity protein-like surface antigen
MKKICFALIVMSVTAMASSLFAQQDAPAAPYRDFPSSGNSTAASPASQPSAAYDPKGMVSPAPYRTSTDLRVPDGTGMNVGLFGGAIAFQNGTLDVNAPGAHVHGTTESEVGGVAGVRFGYTWPHFFGDPNSGATGPDFLMPAVDEEFFWSGYDYKANSTSLGLRSSLTTHLNTYNFMVDPKLKFKVGIFRPYIGYGIGASYLTTNDTRVRVHGVGVGELSGSSDDVAFSIQALAGTEVFVAKNWALSLDYKYQYIFDPSFSSGFEGTTVKYRLNGLGGNMFTAGVNYYF